MYPMDTDFFNPRVPKKTQLNHYINNYWLTDPQKWHMNEISPFHLRCSFFVVPQEAAMIAVSS